MTVIVKSISQDEIIVEGIRLLFSVKRRYVRVDEDLWYSKKLKQRFTFGHNVV
jgi:hypothetical protein